VVTALDALAADLGIARTELAEGIVRVANARMEGAIRVISIERGHDPRDFTLVSFGGAGAMHAAELAAALSIPRVVVPRAAGTLSALGMLLADQVRDYSLTVLRETAATPSGELEEAFAALEERAHTDFAADGVEAPELERSVDLRYVGQGYELEVPWGDEIEVAFHDRHRQRYGYSDRERATEVVTVRVRAVSPTTAPTPRRRSRRGPDPTEARIGDHGMVFAGAETAACLYDRDLLHPENTFAGPALVVEYSCTTVVPPGWCCTVDDTDSLVLERSAP
jgi:N-methylhydantoinase A